VVYAETGSVDVLRVVDTPLRDPGPGELRVRMHRSGVNPTDWKSRQGGPTATPKDPPQVPNHDGAGVVDAIGEGVEAAGTACGSGSGRPRTNAPKARPRTTPSSRSGMSSSCRTTRRMTWAQPSGSPSSPPTAA
jgi:D-arabinose 1-dehydrogenase-like Zn-dependent alcohol dehydrogenase